MTFLPPSERYVRAATASGIPEYMIEGLWNYTNYHIRPGHFLTALLSGNLFEALRRADDQNFDRLGNYARFLYNNVPASCFGSPEAVAAWLANKENV